MQTRATAALHLPGRGGSTAPGDGTGAVITVRGGPGSGKTALAVRLLGHLMRHHPTTRPRFITPSGTLRAHLLDAVSGHSAARELFPGISYLRAAARQAGALVIDEAQRIKRGGHGLPPDLAAVIEHVPLAVVFLDERQIIRPDEGTTVEEIHAAAGHLGRAHHHLELTGSFRCAGSAAYTAWVDALLYGTPRPWKGHTGYDLGLTDDPFQLQQWVEQTTAAVWAVLDMLVINPWAALAHGGAEFAELRKAVVGESVRAVRYVALRGKAGPMGTGHRGGLSVTSGRGDHAELPRGDAHFLPTPSMSRANPHVLADTQPLPPPHPSNKGFDVRI
ncbi:DNA/RNA helicase domain-containing protein [Streptomyces sp. NPDC048266]|uniref:DNA/RNA helicase domain-containing protein n=1 Tax=Streptomyces sp. NPDC048266 TaxID=3155787 RepID=UPI0033C14699